MSHIVSIQSRVRDSTAAAAACQRLNLAAPAVGTAKLLGGSVRGLLVQLPDWKYPAVVDLATGEVVTGESEQRSFVHVFFSTQPSSRIDARDCVKRQPFPNLRVAAFCKEMANHLNCDSRTSSVALAGAADSILLHVVVQIVKSSAVVKPG